jgi:hypothetical protein
VRRCTYQKYSEEKKEIPFMENVRFIISRRIWLFSGFLALLLCLLGLLLLPSVPAHAASVQECSKITTAQTGGTQAGRAAVPAFSIKGAGQIAANHGAICIQKGEKGQILVAISERATVTCTKEQKAMATCGVTRKHP